LSMDEFSRFIAADTQMWERINKMLRK